MSTRSFTSREISVAARTPDRFRCVAQGLADIFELELGKLGDDLFMCLALSHHGHHGGDRNAQVANTEHTPAAVGINGDARERHGSNRLWQRPYLLSLCGRKAQDP